MNIDYIKSTGGFIKGIFFTLIVSLMALSSCSDDAIERQEPTPPNPNNQNADVLFEVNMPHSTVPTTYALTPTQENDIKSIEIILFKIDGTNKTYTGKPYYCDKIENIAGGSISAKKRFSVSLPKGGPYDIVILANSRQEVENILVTSTPTVTDKDDVLALLTATHAGKWISDTNDLNYKPIPMWGEMGGATVAENLRFDVDLIRMMAKIDVEITTDAQSDFVLFAVHLVKANTAGHIVPAPASFNAGLAIAPTLISPLPAPLTLTYLSSDYTDGDKALKGIIYTFEASKAAAGSLSDATCVVLQGSYKGVPDNFYRVDFGAKGAGGVVTYLDILRNFRYDVKIKSISGTGQANLDDAIKNPSTNIISDLVVWDNNELPIIVWDNKYTLGLSADDIATPFLASNENRLKVMTDYAGGWKIDKIEYDASSGTGWFDATPKKPAVGSEGVMADIKFSVTENTGVTPRICYIYISAGPLTHKVKVTQMAVARLSKIVWVDYDGVGDSDAGLTTITVEQTGGTAATMTSTIGGSVITPNIIADGTITKITLTYKGYALDVPIAKYSVDAPTQTLNVTDRTLIGKAVHMDNIRLDLTGSYIQVSDVDLAIYSNWRPIGTTVDTQFTGNYDGGSGNGGTGYKIDNLRIDRSANNTGLFGYAVGATFKNIHIASGAINGGYTVGAIVGNIYNGIISGCTNATTISITGASSNYAGGICGSSRGPEAVIFNCHNLMGATIEGSITVGGIAGGYDSVGEVKNCTNMASISGSSNVGGLFGSNYGIIDVTNSNTGSVAGSYSVGGIVGSNGGTISGIINTTPITSAGGYSLGGICGQNTGIVQDCINNAAISGSSSVGGICGINYAGTVDGSTNAAKVTAGSDYTGGIVGWNSGAAAKITDCDNLTEGIIEGSARVGGICGHNDGTVELSTNAAKVTAGSDYTGGIVGWNNGAAAKITDCDNLTKGIIEGSARVGGVCGNNTGTISGCSNEATVTSVGVSSMYVGGITGSNHDAGTISDCENNGAITGEGSYLGGIAGYNDLSTITKCYNNAGGSVNATGADSDRTGGIAGANYDNAAISGCLNAATVSGLYNVGGISGENKGKIWGCYNVNSIEGDDSIGGIIGQNSGSAEVYACYNIGGVTASPGASLGPVIGGDYVTTTKTCYYGGDASNMTSQTGVVKFANGVWPTAVMYGWGPTGSWAELGDWNLGAPIYPTLAP